jgi:4-hydroxymandelate oxidase
MRWQGDPLERRQEARLAVLANLRDIEREARARLAEPVYDYFAGGAGDERTLARNEAAWADVRLRPRQLVDVGDLDTSIELLGRRLAVPVLTAPCAFNVLAHRDGEIGVARATAAAGTVQVLSMQATTSLEDVAASGPGERWLQLAVLRDRGITRALVERAEAAGYGAICATVDVPVLGRRERDVRNAFRLPAGIEMANLAPYVPAGLVDTDPDTALARFVNSLFDPTLTWEAIDWLCAQTPLPVLVKGVVTGEDARLAVDHGAAGVMVSNHGGRQLDGALSTCEALPEVVDAVGGRVPITVDGGIRRGTDVIAAVAMGASAVLVGRPYLWALAVGGEAGVRDMLAMLRAEIGLAMALLGRRSIADLDPSILARSA